MEKINSGWPRTLTRRENLSQKTAQHFPTRVSGSTLSFAELREKIILILLSLLFCQGCHSHHSVKSDNLKYNYLENEWSYEAQESELKYNYLENRWEWSE